MNMDIRGSVREGRFLESSREEPNELEVRTDKDEQVNVIGDFLKRLKMKQRCLGSNQNLHHIMNKENDCDTARLKSGNKSAEYSTSENDSKTAHLQREINDNPNYHFTTASSPNEQDYEKRSQKSQHENVTRSLKDDPLKSSVNSPKHINLNNDNQNFVDSLEIGTANSSKPRSSTPISPMNAGSCSKSNSNIQISSIVYGNSEEGHHKPRFDLQMTPDQVPASKNDHDIAREYNVYLSHNANMFISSMDQKDCGAFLGEDSLIYDPSIGSTSCKQNLTKGQLKFLKHCVKVFTSNFYMNVLQSRGSAICRGDHASLARMFEERLCLKRTIYSMTKHTLEYGLNERESGVEQKIGKLCAGTVEYLCKVIMIYNDFLAEHFSVKDMHDALYFSFLCSEIGDALHRRWNLINSLKSVDTGEVHHMSKWTQHIFNERIQSYSLCSGLNEELFNDALAIPKIFAYLKENRQFLTNCLIFRTAYCPAGRSFSDLDEIAHDLQRKLVTNFYDHFFKNVDDYYRELPPGVGSSRVLQFITVDRSYLCGELTKLGGLKM